MPECVVVTRLPPKVLYEFFCVEHGIHPNQTVSASLQKICLLCAASTLHPNDAADSSSPIEDEDSAAYGSCSTTLDLSQNFLGVDGLRPLLHTIRVLHCVSVLRMCNTMLDSRQVLDLARYLDGVASVRELDLSGNERITHTAAKALRALILNNANVEAVRVHGTSISGATQRELERLCELNRSLPPAARQLRLDHQRRARAAQPLASMPTPMKSSTTAMVVPSSSEAVSPTRRAPSTSSGLDTSSMMHPRASSLPQHRSVSENFFLPTLPNINQFSPYIGRETKLTRDDEMLEEEEELPHLLEDEDVLLIEGEDEHDHPMDVVFRTLGTNHINYKKGGGEPYPIPNHPEVPLTAGGGMGIELSALQALRDAMLDV